MDNILELISNKLELDTYKPVHYFYIYIDLFAKYRNKTLNIFEIGVSEGGSLEFYKHLCDYFNIKYKIVGIDIKKYTPNYIDSNIKSYVCDSNDINKLNQIIKEEFDNKIDIIIDDGSHISHDIIFSIENLYQYLVDGGVYIIEDLHTLYWGKSENRSEEDLQNNIDNIGMRYIKDIMDALQNWSHNTDNYKFKKFNNTIFKYELYDSILLLYKGKTFNNIENFKKHGGGFNDYACPIIRLKGKYCKFGEPKDNFKSLYKTYKDYLSTTIHNYFMKIFSHNYEKL